MNCKNHKYFLLFIVAIALYILIGWQSIRAPFSSFDDTPELYYVRGVTSVCDFIFRDVFGFFRPVKNLLFLAFSYLAGYDMFLTRLLAVSIGIWSFIPVNILFRRLLYGNAMYGLTRILHE